jgi:hypothetical protein
MSVRDIDKGWNKIRAEMSEFAKHDVIVGWIEGKKDERNEEGDQASGINNATLAAIHEFGTNDGTIPPGRLGFREWQDRSQGEIGKRIEDAYRNSISRGGDAKRELNKLGLWAVSAWRLYQRTVQPGPEIGDSREKQIVRQHGRKAFFKSKKLVDTGQLVLGATHVVRRRVGG